MILKNDKITLGHGAGGRRMHSLISELFLKEFNNPVLSELGDSALINIKGRIAFSTDSFVVDPVIFEGGDIGKLSVCGTINDLVVSGAIPKFLSLAIIAEEGLDILLLKRIVASIKKSSKAAGITIVTGDFKVVEKGACDNIFINTAGIGISISGRLLAADRIVNGDKIIVTGNIAEHGLAVLSRRMGFSLEGQIRSDCAALNGLILPVLRRFNSIKFMRDPTRGGLATTLNEIAKLANVGLVINEKDIPVTSKVNAGCELLGMDPLFIANEGKAVIIAESRQSLRIVDMLRRHPLGKNAAIIGSVVKNPARKVIIKTITGSRRVLDMAPDEITPRIC
ncbi:MAG: hydrogenase expression/formation protein HypE [Candidatus Omnitrophota bacterium]|jgi:hydrogenase expression/formation protein HypE|nr:MAG: hydrogenase expression/formation protein HypE [Candidatus Omnitrophota bacterium]